MTLTFLAGLITGAASLLLAVALLLGCLAWLARDPRHD